MPVVPDSIPVIPDSIGNPALQIPGSSPRMTEEVEPEDDEKLAPQHFPPSTPKRSEPIPSSTNAKKIEHIDLTSGVLLFTQKPILNVNVYKHLQS
jgi:hypothetical protein